MEHGSSKQYCKSWRPGSDGEFSEENQVYKKIFKIIPRRMLERQIRELRSSAENFTAGTLMGKAVEDLQ